MSFLQKGLNSHHKCRQLCTYMSQSPVTGQMGNRHEQDYTLEDKGDINAYLGINVTRPTKTSIKLNQPALIQRIMDSLNLKDQCQHDMLADSVLFKDSEGDPQKTDFHYRSLIG